MSTDLLVDALPYFDQGYDDPGVRETSLAMVEEECRRYRPTKNYLEHLPQISSTAFETELMSKEFERIQNRQPMEPLSMKRYELPPPPPSKISELSAWQDSVENSMAQLEHQAVRAMNLELMLEYGCETWKLYLDVLTSMLANAQSYLEEIKKDIQDINWQRKEKQTQAGDKLRMLETQWVVLVSKNYEIELVCARLEEEIAKLKKDEPQTIEENGSTEDNETPAMNGVQEEMDTTNGEAEPSPQTSEENGNSNENDDEQKNDSDSNSNN